MDWPNVCILLLTYERGEYAATTLESVLAKSTYSGQRIVHIADDGSAPEHRQRLVDIAAPHLDRSPTVSNSMRGGYGANYNLALQVAHLDAGIVLPLEDDWELRRPLDLDPLVSALRENQFGCIRLGYLGYTQPLRGEFVYVSGDHYLLLDPDSPEPHVWAGHPRLETKEWQRRAGPWPEGLNPGSTEFAVAQRPEARQGVAWPVDVLHPRGDLFAHIGTLQAREDQREVVEV